MAYLPARPLQLKRGFVAKTLGTAVVLSVLSVSTAACMLFYGQREIRAGLEESRTWRNGEVAREASVEGQEQTHSILGLVTIVYEYDLTVEYEDAQGEAHRAKVETTSFLQQADTASDPVVKYDPLAPERVAVSWFSTMWGPALWWALMAVMGPVVALGGVAFLRTSRRAVRSARVCAARSDEVEVQVLEVQKVPGRYGVDSKMWRVKYALPASPVRRGGKREVVLHGEPILVAGGTKAVALVSPELPEHPTLPTRALHPFEVSPDELRAFEARLAADGGPVRAAG
jgi:hypothetical protein